MTTAPGAARAASSPARPDRSETSPTSDTAHLAASAMTRTRRACHDVGAGRLRHRRTPRNARVPARAAEPPESAARALSHPPNARPAALQQATSPACTRACRRPSNIAAAGAGLGLGRGDDKPEDSSPEGSSGQNLRHRNMGPSAANEAGDDAVELVEARVVDDEAAAPAHARFQVTEAPRASLQLVLQRRVSASSRGFAAFALALGHRPRAGPAARFRHGQAAGATCSASSTCFALPRRGGPAHGPCRGARRAACPEPTSRVRAGAAGWSRRCRERPTAFATSSCVSRNSSMRRLRPADSSIGFRSSRWMFSIRPMPEGRVVGHLAHQGRKALQPRDLRGAPAALAARIS